jgi:hypothetical protein
MRGDCICSRSQGYMNCFTTKGHFWVFVLFGCCCCSIYQDGGEGKEVEERRDVVMGCAGLKFAGVVKE